MLRRHLNSFNVTNSYESHSKQTIHLAVWIPGNSKPIAKGSIRKEAYVCELNANQPLLPSLPPSSPYPSFLSLSLSPSPSPSLSSHPLALGQAMLSADLQRGPCVKEWKPPAKSLLPTVSELKFSSLGQIFSTAALSDSLIATS